MKVVIITVGDELLIGQVVDSNSAWIGSRLAELGIEIALKLAVADELAEISKGLDFAFQSASIVLMTGGLGPTKDDVTKKALASYFDRGMTFSKTTYDRITNIFEMRGIPITDAHKAQCYLPDSATILENGMGTAPGMWMEEDERIIVSMPGVPHEMKYIMNHGVLPRLEARSNNIYRQKTIRTAGIGESVLAEMIEPILTNHPVKVAYLPSSGQVRLRLSKKGHDLDQVKSALSTALQAVETVISRYVFGYDEVTLQMAVGDLLLSRGMSLGTAESCTGGYLAHMITSVPGSSRYYLGSLVTYSNEMKQKLLKVPRETLIEHGAVSEETVTAMAQGALRSLGCDIAVAITGISGPGGGSDNKPVGTVWIAVGNNQVVKARRFLFTKDRIINIKYTAVYGLIMVRNFLLGR